MARYLVTGGAGFIGSNLAHRLINEGHQVVVYDDLSRLGTDKNVAWLQATHGHGWALVQADVRDFGALRAAIAGADVVYHLASQVAVTTSVQDPRHDFEVNALGTFNVLEAARLAQRRPLVLYASTNKVYGGMEDVVVLEGRAGYAYRDFPQAFQRPTLSIFTRRMVAPKGQGTSTCATMPASMTCPPSSFASRASMARASLVWRTRGG